MRRAQVGLGAAGLGALFLVFPFGKALNIAGLVLVVSGAVLGTSFERKSHVWWGLFMAGAILCLLSPFIAVAAESLGGMLAVIGGTLILVSVVLAFPVHGEAP